MFSIWMFSVRKILLRYFTFRNLLLKWFTASLEFVFPGVVRGKLEFTFVHFSNENVSMYAFLRKVKDIFADVNPNGEISETEVLV